MYPCVFWSQSMALRFAVLITTLNPLTPKISLIILLTVCHIVLVMLVLRIWCWINY